MSDTHGRSPRWVAFGRWFADQRVKLGRKHGHKVTQEDIALKLNMHPRHISRIETGESGTELNRFPDIAKALEVEEIEVYKAAGIGASIPSDGGAYELRDARTGENVVREDRDGVMTVSNEELMSEVKELKDIIKELAARVNAQMKTP